MVRRLNKRIGFISLGCAKNLTDTETMLALVSEGGLEITGDPAEADVLVVNTCAFIESAQRESIDTILEMAEYKKDKCRMLIVTGCLSQRYKDEIFAEIPEVDVILGTNDYDKILDAVNGFFAGEDNLSCVSDKDCHITENLPRILSTPPYTAYIKIADGCDNFCTYCIIPQLRGKFRSRPEADIVSEAKEFAESGVRELILVAQDTAYYGKDIGSDISSLLKKLSAIDGIEWIRLQYCYPENISDDLIDEISENEKIVKYIDMPLQHISDNVLKKMGRRSRKAEVELLLEKLREKVDGIAVRTSIIVGFPGETEEDFAILKKFLKEQRLDRVGVFTYSREEGTVAYSMDNQVSDELKESRRNELMAQQAEISAELNREKIGKTVQAIAEGYDEENFCYVGRSFADTPEVDGMAYIYSTEELAAGQIVDMKIIDAHEYDVTGEVIIRQKRS